MHRFALSLGALTGAVAVLLGAFGAHALETALGGLEEAESRLATWEIGARYQMYHALALVAAGCVAGRCQTRWLDRAVLCFLTGTVVFSGCLYAIVLTGITVLGAIVPIGGVLLTLGWFFLAWSTVGREQ